MIATRPRRLRLRLRRRMRRPLWCAAGLLASAGALGAQPPVSVDFGGWLATELAGGVFGQDWHLATNDSVALWAEVSHHVGAAELRYRVADDVALTTAAGPFLFPAATPAGLASPGVAFPHLRSLELHLSAAPFPPGAAFQLAFGRRQFSDPTGFVLDHRLDGVSLRAAWWPIAVQLDAAYLGLVWKNGNHIFMSSADVDDLQDTDTFFAPRRWFGQLALETTQLLDQQVQLFGLAQLDACPAGSVDSYYLGLRVAGLITPYLSHYSFVVVQIPDGVALTETAVAGQLQMAAQFAQLSFLSGEIAARYASGAAGGMGRFSPPTSASTGRVFASRYENLVTFSQSVAIRPFADSPLRWLAPLEPRIDVQQMWRQDVASPAALLGLDPPGVGYYGTELAIAVDYPALSDLELSLSGGGFFPNGLAGIPFLDLAVRVSF